MKKELIIFYNFYDAETNYVNQSGSLPIKIPYDAVVDADFIYSDIVTQVHEYLKEASLASSHTRIVITNIIPLPLKWESEEKP